MTATATEQKSSKIDLLRFCKLKIPHLIPVEFVEAVKGNSFTPQQFYTYQKNNIDNPRNLLYALIDPDDKIQGFLWMEINNVDKSLYIDTFSISKEYWGKGKAMFKAIEFIDNLDKQLKPPRILWATTNAKFFEKYGFKRSKVILMERQAA